MEDDKSQEPSQEQEAKQSTKTFDQSDFDRMIAKERAKLAEKYADYDNLKQTTAELLEFKKQAEMEKMTETEKAQKQISELSQQLEQATIQNSELIKKTIKNDILSRSEFSKLPRAYKSLVSASENEEAVLESARAVLDEWKQDFDIKDPTTTIGASPVVGAEPAMAGNNGAVSSTWRQQFVERLKKGN